VGWSGRLWRWCRRKPAVASLAAALLLGVAVGFPAVILLWLSADYHRRQAEQNLEDARNEKARAEQNLEDARRENSRAEANLDKAREAVDECLAVAHKHPLLQKEGLQPARAMLLAVALRYYQEFIKQREGDPRMQKELARNYAQVAFITDQIGSKADALAAYQRSRDILQKLVDEQAAGRAPEDLDVVASLAGACNNIALLQKDLGDPAAALASYQEARAILEPFRDRAGATELRQLLAMHYANIGVLKQGTGDPAAGLQSFEQARDLIEALARDRPAAPDFRRQLAGTCINIGICQRERGDRTAALRSHERARDLLEELVRDQPGVHELRDNLALRYFLRDNLALSYYNIGLDAEEPAAALRALERARDIRTELVRDNPTVTQFHSNLGETYHHLARQLRKMGRREEALAAYRQAVSEQRVALEKVPQVTLYRQRLNTTYHDLAGLLRELGRAAEAADTSEECLKLWPGHVTELYTVGCELALCVRLAGQGRAELTARQEAERRGYADRAVELLRQAVAAGFKDLKKLRENPDLDPLRARDDFKQMLAELAEKANAPAK
jgi:tetratricopeptide (TPR) repeat protein